MTFVMITLEHHNVKFSMNDKESLALSLFIESVHKPDSRLRACAHNQDCYDELMQLREDVLNMLYVRQKVLNKSYAIKKS